MYRSNSLEKLWTKGNSIIGDVTFESAAYVARYVTKKITGKDADAHYEIVNKDTGEVKKRQPEFTTMSRRPGIGRGWYDKYCSDVYNYDYVVLNGKKLRPPKYYDSRFEIENPNEYKKIKSSRKILIKENASDNTYDRVRAKEHHQLLKFKLLKRSMENDEGIHSL